MFFFCRSYYHKWRLWQALHGARFIPDLIQHHSQGPLNIKIRNHLITNKQDLLLMQVKT